MLFRYTENPPEKAISPPAALRVSAVAFSYTENSSFPYSPFWALSTGLSDGQTSYRLSAQVVPAG